MQPLLNFYIILDTILAALSFSYWRQTGDERAMIAGIIFGVTALGFVWMSKDGE